MVEKGVGTSLGRELGLRRVARFSLGRGCAIVEVLVVLVKICVMVMFMFVPSPVTVRGAGGDGHAVSGTSRSSCSHRGSQYASCGQLHGCTSVWRAKAHLSESSGQNGEQRPT